MENLICRVRKNAQSIVSFACAVFMLCILPLLFHNGFFDINRFKVSAVCTVMPYILAAFLVSLLIRPRNTVRRAAPADICASAMSMAAFALVCVVSSARTGFDTATLTGSEGRYCGLYFLLSCAAAFFIMASGMRRMPPVGTAAICCAGAVAALGIANSLGLDPLGFYEKIQKGQESLFLSTIGNIDFFGAYLAMLFPLAGARFVCAGRRRLGSFVLSIVMLLGVAASRTDSPFFSLQLSCAMLFVWAGGDWSRIRRALTLWGICWLTIPLMRVTFAFKGEQLSSLMFALSGWALILGMAGLAAACLCKGMERRRVRSPGRRKLILWTGMLLGAAVLALVGAMAYFTLLDTQTELGAMSALLRFDDSWGSRRGFVYVRSLRAFMQYSFPDKLFGGGVDLAKRSLMPYFDNAEMLAYGTFNDAHCQPLQMLLTCGLIGMLAFLALYVFTLRALLRHTDEDPLLWGLLASLAGYGVIMLVQVTQPILIATYVSLCALALSRIRYPEEGSLHEP